MTCIVLDIDKTLVNTIDDPEFKYYKTFNVFGNIDNFELRNKLYALNLIDAIDKPGQGFEIQMSGSIRPYAIEFIDFCLDNFDVVIVWSAGRERYVYAMCDILFPNYKRQPDLILTFDDCINKDRDIIKPLSKIYSMKNYGITPEKTLVVDDTPSTFSQNRDNSFHVPQYDFKFYNKGKDNDNYLLKLMEFIKKEVFHCKDVRSINKIFSQ
jgi:hypothetical protein